MAGSVLHAPAGLGGDLRPLLRGLLSPGSRTAGCGTAVPFSAPAPRTRPQPEPYAHAALCPVQAAPRGPGWGGPGLCHRARGIHPGEPALESPRGLIAAWEPLAGQELAVRDAEVLCTGDAGAGPSRGPRPGW